jgi:NAD(P)-dependent dehydrogenase (short-subunit alcohol dehydrogenase family)
MTSSACEKFLRDFEAASYAEAKLANILFTFELQRRWQGKGVQACAVDPGAVASDIWKRTKYNRPPWKWLAKVLKQAYPSHLLLDYCSLSIHMPLLQLICYL